MAPLYVKPTELEPYWVPFTPNRAFKKRPRLFAGAKGMHYFKPDGTKVLDATSGLFCVNAGHCREPIGKAIQEQAAKLDYSPAFPYRTPHALAPLPAGARRSRLPVLLQLGLGGGRRRAEDRARLPQGQGRRRAPPVHRP